MLSLGNGKLKRKELRASLVKGQGKNICLFLVVVIQNENQLYFFVVCAEIYKYTILY